jgi:hypothetical protein
MSRALTPRLWFEEFMRIEGDIPLVFVSAQFHC